jgi:hypothetical protein
LKLTSPVMRKIEIMYHLADAMRGTHHHSVIFLPKMHNLNLIMRKWKINSHWARYSTKHLTCNLQKCQVFESQRKTNCFRLKEIKEKWQLNACDPGWDVCLNDIIGAFAETWMRF